jgi:predicted cupin superfamily sugar epimerase
MQKCGDMTFFPSFSFEQLYQGIRRCWRFGRNDPVNVHMVCAEGESGVTARLKIKQEKSERMFQEVVKHMRAETMINSEDKHHTKLALPKWS